MQVSKNIMVLDTETVHTLGFPVVHDLGYQIIDKYNRVVCTRHFWVMEVRALSDLLNKSEFYKAHKTKYDELEKQGFKSTRWCEIVATILQDMKKYKVKTISAYHLAFDYRALRCTDTLFSYGKNELLHKLEKVKHMCIWHLATQTLLNTTSAKMWIDENGFISDKGNRLSSAEVAYKYITNNPIYIEEHTALEDVKIEVEILTTILENYKGRVDYGLKWACWKQIQD